MLVKMTLVQSSKLAQLTSRSLLRSSFLSAVRRSMSVKASLSLAVKGDPETKVLGDCPFCHRVMLTMNQKELEYDKIYIDFSRKPQWLLDANPAGSVPVLKDNEDYIPDSSAIVEYLERKFPTPAVPVDDEGLAAGDGIFGAFRNLFLNKEPSEEDSLKTGLESELQKLEDRLKTTSGPFLGGDVFNAADCVLLPKLHHAKIALGHFKKWTIPDSMVKVNEYLAKAYATDTWKKSEYSTDLVIAGWGKKL